MVFPIFSVGFPFSVKRFWAPVHRHVQKYVSLVIQNLVGSEVGSSYLLLFTLDRAVAHGRQSEHHARARAERSQLELLSMHHDLFQKEGPPFSLFKGASPKLCLPRRRAFSVPKKVFYRLLRTRYVPFLRVLAICL